MKKVKFEVQAITQEAEQVFKDISEFKGLNWAEKKLIRKVMNFTLINSKTLQGEVKKSKGNVQNRITKGVEMIMNGYNLMIHRDYMVTLK